MKTVLELGRGEPLPPPLYFIPHPFLPSSFSPLTTQSPPGLAGDCLPQPTHLHTPSFLAY